MPEAQPTLSEAFATVARAHQVIADHPALEGVSNNVSPQLANSLRALIGEAMQPLHQSMQLLRDDVAALRGDFVRMESAQKTESAWTLLRFQNAEAKGDNDPLVPLPTIVPPPGGVGAPGPFGPPPNNFPATKGGLSRLSSGALRSLLLAYAQAVPHGVDARRAAFSRFIGAKQ